MYETAVNPIFYKAFSRGAAFVCRYVKLGRTKDALDTITEFFKKTSATMIIAYLAALLFSVALFIAVVTGQTAMPVWTCVFNPILLTIVMFLLKVPAAANVAGFITFTGLFFLM